MPKGHRTEVSVALGTGSEEFVQSLAGTWGIHGGRFVQSCVLRVPSIVVTTSGVFGVGLEPLFQYRARVKE